MTERLHFHFSLACIGEGNGNQFQCSFLENPRHGGVWRAAIYGVAQSRTQLKRFSSSSSSSSPTFPAPLVEETVFFPFLYSCLLCRRLIDHRCLDLFLGSLFCSIDPYACFYTKRYIYSYVLAALFRIGKTWKQPKISIDR